MILWMKNRLPRFNQAGFSLIELLVVIGLIGVLMAFLLPALEKARESALKIKCASNIRQVGISLVLYANENHGNYPRTTYIPGAPLTEGTNPAAVDPFKAGGVQPNDVTAALFLLIRTQDVLPQIFICPYNDVNVFGADQATNIRSRSNFTDYTKNLGYSYANPYPDKAAVAAGYALNSQISPRFVLAADLNPGLLDDNTKNHEDEGQNVLYADGHVEWQRDALCGMNKDNIYRTRGGAVSGSPGDAMDTILLPVQK